MSRFVVDLGQPSKENTPNQAKAADQFEAPPLLINKAAKPKKRRGFLKVLGVLGILLSAALLAIAVGSYFYWQSVKKTPQYSLALLVDAARRDDQKTIDELVDTNAVVENFMPQITDKAVELYGRNLPPQVISKVKQAAAPLMPAIKTQAKAELPRLIREKTEPVPRVPYWLIALFADRAVDVRVERDTAFVSSKIAETPLELTMKRDGEIWKVIAVKDDVLARRIAEKIGQEIIAVATKGGIKKAADQFGVKGLDDILKNGSDILK